MTASTSTLEPQGIFATLHKWLFDGEFKDGFSQQIERSIAFLIIASVLAVVCETIPALTQTYAQEVHIFDLITVTIFSIEYVLRVATAHLEPEYAGKRFARLRYMFSFYALVDLVAIAPFYIASFVSMDVEMLRVLRLLRLMRIFKLSRYNSAFDDMVAAVKSERDSFSSAIFLMFIASLLFSSMIYIIEGHAQPDVFPSIPAAMHWFFVTIISGWGNIEPITFVGSVLVIFTQVLSIALAAILTGVVATAYTAQVERREALYEMELRDILADGVVTEEEEIKLKNMQAKYGMSDEQVEAIAAQVRAEKDLPA